MFGVRRLGQWAAVAAGLVLGTHGAAAQAPANWTGLYAGAHAGYLSSSMDWTTNQAFGLNIVAGGAVSHDPKGFLFGGQLGYNYQFNRNWLVGVEGTFSFTNADDTSSKNFPLTTIGGFRFADQTNFKSEIDWIATLTGRLGYVQDSWLFYVKGGAAWAKAQAELSGNVTIRNLDNTINASILYSWSDNRMMVGWTVGGGVEYMLTRNWIVGLEYNYIDFGKKDFSGATTPAGFFSASIDTQIHTGTARVSYKF